MSKAETTATVPPLLARLGVITRADGSAQVSFGGNTAMAGVFGPVSSNPQRELVDRAAVDVYYGPRGAGPLSCSPAHRETEAIVRGTVEEAVVAALHPRAAIHLALQPLEADAKGGGELACCVNAACLALVDASLPMRFLFAAVEVAVDASGKIQVLPPCDDAVSRKFAAKLTFIFESTKQDVLASRMEGKCTEKKFQECLGLAKESSLHVFNFYRESIKKKFSKDL